MPLPATFDTITVTGTYMTLAGVACTGTVTFTPPADAWLKHIDTDTMIVPVAYTATLNSSGAFSIALPLTDDPDVVPNFSYAVSENINVGTVNRTRTYNVEVLSALLPGPVDLSDLAPTGVILTGTTALTKTTADLLYAPIGSVGGESDVTSVAGRTGAVVLTKTDVGLSNVDNTTDAAKPVSSATQTALDAKAPTASPTFTGTVSGVTKSMVGLGSVDNTADADKPVSSATATALAAKAPNALSKRTVSTDYTVVLDDATDRVIHSTSATAVTVTLPADTTAIPLETAIPWRQYGAGQITFTAGVGATVLSRGAVFKSAGQYAEGLLTKTAASTWLLSGDIAA